MSDIPSFSAGLVLTLLALLVVLVFAWLAIRLLASLSRGRLNSGRIKVVQSVPVGTRERLTLVELDGREYLLGVTSGGISVINHQAASRQSRIDNSAV